MKDFSDKSRENKNWTVANDDSRKKQEDSSAQTEDKSLEAIQMRALQEGIDQSEEVKQLQAFSDGISGEEIVQRNGTLEELGIESTSSLEQWLNSKNNEMDSIASALYTSIDQTNKELGIEDSTDDGKRTGLCGITCEAIMDHIKSSYPAVGALVGQHSYGGEHYALLFSHPDGGSIVMDPTYRQFDKEGAYDGASHIWIGNPGDHPFY